MQIEKKDLIGTWQQIATERNDQVRQSTDKADIWTFNDDGEAVYKYIDLKNYSTHMDRRPRSWSLTFINEVAFISIDEEKKYKIIVIDKKKMVAENLRNGLKYHYEKE